MSPYPPKLPVTIVAALLLSACAELPPAQSMRVDNAGLLPPHWQGPAEAGPLRRKLLSLVDDPVAVALVQQALTGNPDLQKTALRLQEQRLLSRQTRAAENPELNASLDSQRARSGSGTSARNNHTLALNLSWELDVWGRLANASSAAGSETRAQERDYLAARNSLAGRVIQRWTELSLRQATIDAEQARIHSLQKTEAVITERYRDGLGSIVDLEAARTATARAEASLIARQETQQAAWRGLSVLLGTEPQNRATLLLSIPTIASPPADIPASVIAARPDLQAAYSRILAADQQTAVAYKALLPGFRLTTGLSQNRPSLGDLLSGSTAWSLLGQLSAPLFNSGRLQADADIAVGRARQAWLDYRRTLLVALREVEDSLGQEAALAGQQQALTRAQEHARASLEHYRTRYREGLADILDLLSAEQSLFDARTELLQVRRDRLNNRISLGLALGMRV